jgi:hypothetical protein
MASEFKYREVPNLLDAVKQLMFHFERYTSIPAIIRVDAIQATLKRHVHESFKLLSSPVRHCERSGVIGQLVARMRWAGRISWMSSCNCRCFLTSESLVLVWLVSAHLL